MKAATRHSLTQSTVFASATAVEKAASANPDQREVIDTVFPHPEEKITKVAALARVLAVGEMVADPA